MCACVYEQWGSVTYVTIVISVCRAMWQFFCMDDNAYICVWVYDFACVCHCECGWDVQYRDRLLASLTFYSNGTLMHCFLTFPSNLWFFYIKFTIFIIQSFKHVVVIHFIRKISLLLIC